LKDVGEEFPRLGSILSGCRDAIKLCSIAVWGLEKMLFKIEKVEALYHQVPRKKHS
jgi:hypothetical protein